jgi:hypothetical protein
MVFNEGVKIKFPATRQTIFHAASYRQRLKTHGVIRSFLRFEYNDMSYRKCRKSLRLKYVFLYAQYHP